MFATFPQLLEEKNWKQKKISKLFRLMQNFLHSKLTARARSSQPKGPYLFHISHSPEDTLIVQPTHKLQLSCVECFR